MSLACIHTHTIFCDGEDDVETCCRTAFSKGLACLGFSAHAPILKKTGLTSEWHMTEKNLPKYIDEVEAAKKRWEGRLPVYLGLEVDYIENLMGPADRDIQDLNLDFIIGSVHYVFPPKGNPFTVDDKAGNVLRGIREGYGGDPQGMVEYYMNAQEAMIRAGSFDVLGHADVIRKHNLGPGKQKNRIFPEDSAYYRAKITSLAALLAGRGVPAEVNTSGLNRGLMTDCYPSLELLKLFRENRVPMLINADAHKAEHIGGNYEKARAEMLSAGYTESLIFEGRKDGRSVWKSEKL